MAERRQRGPGTFRQRDVIAAVKAAERAGKTVRSFRIDRNGAIEVIFGEPEKIGQEEANPWDRLLSEGPLAVR